MAIGRKRGRSMYKEVDAEVEIEFDDILEYVEDYASDSELKDILEKVKSASESNLSSDILFEDLGFEGTFIRREKLELLSAAFKKFSLEQLEAKLGTKFELM